MLATEKVKVGDTISVHYSKSSGTCGIFLTRFKKGKEVYKSQPETFSGDIEQAKKEIQAIASKLNAMAYPTREESAFSIYDIVQ